MRWLLSCAAGLLAVALFPVFSSAERGASMTRTECTSGNLAVVETALSEVLGQAPRIIGPASCDKSAYSSDLVALVEIDAAAAPADWRFAPASDEAEAPLHLLAALDPEVFAGLDLAELGFSGGFSRELRKNVYLLRLPSGRLFALVTDFF